MKKLSVVFLFVIFLSGCATYKVQQVSSAQPGGFVVSRHNKIIPEYTIGVNNTYPDQVLAKERFKRRRVRVESYYKQMGFMDSRFKQFFVEPPTVLFQFVPGFPYTFIAFSDYKYNNDPKYKEKIDKLEDEEYNAEREKINRLKDELKEYIKEDLNSEGPQEARTPSKAEVAEVKNVPVKKEEIMDAPVKAEVKPDALSITPQTSKEESLKPREQPVQGPVKKAQPPILKTQGDIAAVIIAKPQSGSSPLKVNFSADSHSLHQ